MGLLGGGLFYQEGIPGVVVSELKPGGRLRRPWGRWVGTGAMAAVLLVIGYAWYQLAPAAPHSQRYDYVRVSPGQSASEIAATLVHRGIIRSALAFNILSRLDHLSRSLKSGVYRLSPHDSLGTILRVMRSGQVVVIKVAIPEGFTAQQVVARLVRAHIGTFEQYQKLERTPPAGMPKPLPGVRDALEGFLFPATYSFPWGTTAPQAISIMWRNFQTQAIQPLYRRAHTQLTLTAWVTMASIIQQENRSPKDAPDIAAVFFNRMALGMPFQSDATVRYALGHVVMGGLSYQDLQVISPYNTYLHAGLPPGPIANPGLVALSAALHPAKVPYLYFLTMRNGRVLFATTYPQHLANIAYANAHP